MHGYREHAARIAAVVWLGGGVLACDGSDTDVVAPAGDAGVRQMDSAVRAEPGASGRGDSVKDAGSADAGSKPNVRAKGPPPEVTAASKAWPLANKDYAGTRATFDSRISSKTVGTLKQAWSFELPAGGQFGSAHSAALALDGVVYYADDRANVYALEQKTGKSRWEKHHDASTIGPNGLAVGWGKVFVCSSETTFVALDMNSGEELWKAPITIPRNGALGVPPIAYDGLVFVSSVPVTSSDWYLGGVNGTLYALDQNTGDIAWEFKTVQDDNLWGHPDINSGGGAWYSPTIDTTKSVVYFGIGNPGPFPGTPEFPLGSSRPGPNLYTNSVLALGVNDGDLKWYHQEAPHDLFDLDFQNPPVIINASLAGHDRQLVVGSGKTGTVVALDGADAGKMLWRTPVGKHENDTVQDYTDAGIDVAPGSLGGVETPIAYADGVVYVSVVNFPIRYYPGSVGDFADTGGGELLAIDVSDGKVLWHIDLPSLALGSATVVNDLVLTSSFDGTVLAFARATGTEVWRFQAPLGINAPLTVVDDMLLIPAGTGVGVPQLIALELE